MASKKPSGLGRGLGALLGDDVMNADAQTVTTLPIAEVESNSAQPRKYFDDAALAELAESIRLHGIIQPLTVRKLSSGYYQIIAGERRWRAARLAGLKEVPVVVMEADDRKAAELAMIENLQREDLNPMEEALGYQALIQQYHMTQEEAAARVGKSRPAVANSLRLLELDPSVQQQVVEGRLSAGHARALVPLSPGPRAPFFRADSLSARQRRWPSAWLLRKKQNEAPPPTRSITPPKPNNLCPRRLDARSGLSPAGTRAALNSNTMGWMISMTCWRPSPSSSNPGKDRKAHESGTRNQTHRAGDDGQAPDVPGGQARQKASGGLYHDPFYRRFFTDGPVFLHAPAEQLRGAR